jgi:zinc finger CCHC domain-containing protein 9
MCYNCGSTEHNAKDCRKPNKIGNEYAYAKCFVCNEQGHLSRQCPKNEKGLYPNGGSCRFCNQVTHLAKDCTFKSKGGN